METVAAIFDELVVFLDENRLTPGTRERVEKVASRVYQYRVPNWYDWDLAAMARECGGDWLLLIERDEELSPHWQNGNWRELLAHCPFTHLWMPRRWILSDNHYITGQPWWPDFQLRLFRNNTDGIKFPRRLHDPIRVPGAGASLTNLAIHHHVLWLCSRTAREERVRYYEQLRPGGALGHYYLYEDHSHGVGSFPRQRTVDLASEIREMRKLSPDDISKIQITVDNVPDVVDSSARFRVNATIRNASERALCAFSPFPIGLAYHWLEHDTREMAIYDGDRTALFPGAPARAISSWQMGITAPPAPGDYILQTTLVQEHVAWFEQITPAILREFQVRVAG